jgi:hypothetical protein
VKDTDHVCLDYLLESESSSIAVSVAQFPVIFVMSSLNELDHGSPLEVDLVSDMDEDLRVEELLVAFEPRETTR